MKKLSCFIFILFLFIGCRQEAAETAVEATGVPTAVSPNEPTPTPASATPTAVSPTADPAADPFAASVTAVRELTALRVESIVEELPTGDVTRWEWEFLLEEQEQWHIWQTWPDGTLEETLCHGGRLRRCRAQVGNYPWTRQPFYEGGFLGYADLYERALAERTVLDVAIDAGDILVTWEEEMPYLSAFTENGIRMGRSWLQADTYLPLRELIELRDKTSGQLIRETEQIFSEHNRPVAPIPTRPPAQIPSVPTAVSPPAEFDTRVEKFSSASDLYLPEGMGPFPAVVVLHGSEGGIAFTRTVAKQLAEAGYVALAYCYFDCPDTPNELRQINLDLIFEAIDSLRLRPEVDAAAVAIVGFSRGAELALILGVLNPDIQAVASIMGSPQVIGAISLEGGVAWRYQDAPLPFIEIPVEQIDGPVLLMHGAVDRLWPATFSYRLAERLEANNHPYELIVFPNRGHEIIRPSDVNYVIDFLGRELD